MKTKIVAAMASAALLFAAPVSAKTVTGRPTGIGNSALGGKAAQVQNHGDANGDARSTFNAAHRIGNKGH